MPKKLKKEPKRKSSSKASKAQVSKQLSRDRENIKSLESQLELAKDKHLRLKAEFDNFRRRKADELSSLLKYGFVAGIFFKHNLLSIYKIL